MASQIISPKRKAIADSSRTMFLWIAAMSAVLGVCVVIAIFLAQQIFFRAKVVGQMTDTLSTLRENNKVASTLASNIVVLETNTALNSVKANAEEKALQVPLDALPADRNTLALGASLQQSLLADIDGLTIESLTIDNADVLSEDSNSNTIPIQLQVSATKADAIKEMLTKMERSIRVIDIDNFVLERSDNSYQATIAAHAYYQPEKKVELTQKTITPGGKN